MGYKQKGNDGWEGWDVNRKGRMGRNRKVRMESKQEGKDVMYAKGRKG